LVFDPRETQGDLAEIRLFLKAVRQGKLPPAELSDPSLKFYILGLSPNASRLSVRFWHVSTIEEMARKLGQHFADLHIQRNFDNEPEFPGIWQLLRETAVQRKSENISPLLGGAVMRSILTGAPYPQNLLSATLCRIRADQDINYLRAAIIKACLVRKARVTHTLKEVAVSLDEKNHSPAYLLGRLFAVLEKAQKDAIPEANTSIKDRYFGSASATPRSVFPVLLRLSQHHIQKAKYGQVSDKRIEEIMCLIKEFPAHLSLEDQGLFALGYYHQRQAFFMKNPMAEEKEV
jgi:CRISPR-associated protein Csd1